jgi:hypothetical protein
MHITQPSEGVVCSGRYSGWEPLYLGEHLVAVELLLLLFLFGIQWPYL